MVVHSSSRSSRRNQDGSWIGRIVAGCCFLGLLVGSSLRGDLAALHDSAQELSRAVTKDLNVLVVGNSGTITSTDPAAADTDDTYNIADRPVEEVTRIIKELQEENRDLQRQIESLEKQVPKTTTDTTTTTTSGTAPRNSLPTLLNRTVSFLQQDVHFHRDDADAYSGMWWTHRDDVLRLQPASMTNLEGASFHVFDKARTVLLTRDWLDFGVEHLSAYFRHFEVDDAPDDYSYQRLIRLFHDYFGRVQAFPRKKASAAAEVSRSTIALLPFADIESTVDDITQTMHSLLADIQKNDSVQPTTLPGEKRRENVLRVQSLAMTLASLWQIGIGRVVVIGRRKQPTEMVQAAFSIFHTWLESKQQHQTMELAYVWGLNETTQDDTVHLPVIALTLFQQVMRTQQGETASMSPLTIREWLGEDATRWKYVYFSEPDLVLTTRPHALEAIAQQLQRGNLMAAHRFQLLPHAVDFPNYAWPGRLVPDQDVFALFHDLDPHNTIGDACCDAGDRHFGLDDYSFCWLWYDCGTRHQEEAYSNVTAMRKAHERLLGYPLVRLMTGLHIPWVQEHARRCIPKRNGECVVKDTKRGSVY